MRFPIYFFVATCITSLALAGKRISRQTANLGPKKRCECVNFLDCEVPADASQTTEAENQNGGHNPFLGLRTVSVNKEQPSCPDPFDICCAKKNLEIETTSENIAAPSYQSKCGKRNGFGIGLRVLNFENPDSEASYGEFPWMVSLWQDAVNSKDKPYVGGGALITPNVVLTAAHKVQHIVKTNNYKLKVRLGDWDSNNDAELFGQVDISVQKIVIHPNYEAFNVYNNYALLFLAEPVAFSEAVDTICLPSGRKYNENECLSPGWGGNISLKKSKTNILQFVVLPLVNHSTCQRQLRTTALGTGFNLHPSFVCAGGEAGLDTCTGDGGSPLVCPLQEDPDTYEVVGIVSWGVGCGQEGIPGVYAKVTDPSVIKWINSQIQNA